MNTDSRIQLQPCPFCKGKVVAHWQPFLSFDGMGDHTGKYWRRHVDIREQRPCNRAASAHQFSAKTEAEALQLLEQAWSTRA